MTEQEIKALKEKLRLEIMNELGIKEKQTSKEYTYRKLKAKYRLGYFKETLIKFWRYHNEHHKCKSLSI